jgi:hypothetical protein
MCAALHQSIVHADPQQVSAAILLSTIVSVVSFPCVAWLAFD